MAANARRFDGTDDLIDVDFGASIGAFGGDSIAAIIKVTATATYKGILWGGLNDAWGFYVQGGEYLGFWNNTSDEFGTTVLGSGWYLVGVTKASGSAAARFHVYDYSTPGWVHESPGAAQADSPAPITGLRIGANRAGGGLFNGDIQAVAYYSSVLSDGDFETMEASSRAWLDLSPTAYWLLNQPTTAENVEDVLGTADQTAITGTTVQTGNPDWDDGTSYSRYFTAPNDEIVVQPRIDGLGPLTICAICRYVSGSGGTKVILSSGNVNGWTFFLSGDPATVNFYNNVASVASVATVSGNKWYFIAITKATGTVAIRYHIYDYAAGSWTRENEATAQANTGATDGTSGWLGQDNNSSGAGFDGRLQAMAVWTGTELSDGTLDGMVETAQSWLDAAPTNMWILNQASIGTAVNDEVGSSDQTAATTTTVFVGLPFWDDALQAAGTVGGAGGMARPGRERGRAPRREGAWW